MSNSAFEHRGVCTSCSAIYFWAGLPALRDAICPVHNTPLQRAKRDQRGLARLNRHPLAKARPPLVVREVES